LTPLTRSLVLYGVMDGSRLTDIEEAIYGGVRCIQIRDKLCTDREFTNRLRTIHPLTLRHGIPLIINDRVHLFDPSLAEGVHIGQSDGNPRDIRKEIGRQPILGVSVHNSTEAQNAGEAGAQYLGVGAVFPTGTKPDAHLIDRKTLEVICAESKLPVVAIGGITENNIMDLAGSGIAGIAAVSAILSGQGSIRERTGRLATLATLVIANGTARR